MISWWWLLVCAWGMFVLFWWVRNAYVRYVNNVVEQDLAGFDQQLFEVKELNEQLEEQLREVNVKWHKSEGLLKVHREANERFEKQRDEAWARYHAAAIGAGSAQAMLLRSLDNAIRELNRYRAKEGKEPVTVNEGLKGIVHEFKREHVEAVRPE